MARFLLIYHLLLFGLLFELISDFVDACAEWEGAKLLKPNAIVTYKDLSLKLAGHCGLVEDLDPEKPNMVWVRWLGDMSCKKENIRDLEEI